jgi:hypothetical protein
MVGLRDLGGGGEGGVVGLWLGHVREILMEVGEKLTDKEGTSRHVG